VTPKTYTSKDIKAMADVLRGHTSPKYTIDERGHTRSDDGNPELSEDEICQRLSEWHCMSERIKDMVQQRKYEEVLHQEQLSMYKKRIQPRLADADRFVALAMAFVTHDPKFAALCDKATLNPATVDEVRAAIDCARSFNREQSPL
jgi:hypothetical protein